MGFVRRHPVLVGALGVVVLAAGALVVTVLTVDEPGPASVEDTLDRFREDGGGEDDERPSPDRPPEGVYVYEGAGEERLSFPPLTQHDGDEMPATVTHRPGGCWVTRVELNAEHWQEWTHCRDDGRIVETAGRTGQAWDIGVSAVENLTRFTCDPANVVVDPDAEPGDEFAQSWSGTNTSIEGTTTSAGTMRFVGREALDVGGTEVPTVHLRSTRTLTGGQEGDERVDLWFRDDGLLVRYERDIEVRTDSPVGAITYTEEGHFSLSDTEPRR